MGRMSYNGYDHYRRVRVNKRIGEWNRRPMSIIDTSRSEGSRPDGRSPGRSLGCAPVGARATRATASAPLAPRRRCAAGRGRGVLSRPLRARLRYGRRRRHAGGDALCQPVASARPRLRAGDALWTRDPGLHASGRRGAGARLLRRLPARVRSGRPGSPALAPRRWVLAHRRVRHGQPPRRPGGGWRHRYQPRHYRPHECRGGFASQRGALPRPLRARERYRRYPRPGRNDALREPVPPPHPWLPTRGDRRVLCARVDASRRSGPCAGRRRRLPGPAGGHEHGGVAAAPCRRAVGHARVYRRQPARRPGHRRYRRHQPRHHRA